MFIHRGLVIGAIGAALTAGALTSAFAAPEATPTAAESCYGPCPSETALHLSKEVVSYGDEEAEVFRVTVRPREPDTGTPTGTVAVESSGMTLCTVTLASGTGTCSLTADELRPGFDRLRAVYSGDSNFSGSTSARRFLEVRRPFRRHRRHFPIGPIGG
jgi:hypothetical protein